MASREDIIAHFPTYQNIEDPSFPGFYVKQQWEALEQISACYEQSNQYEISNIPKEEFRDKGMEGNILLFEAEEKTGLCCRLCCGENRPFKFDLVDKQSKAKMVTFERAYRCCGCALIPFCAHKVNVHWMVNEADGTSVGSTSEKTRMARVRAPFGGGCWEPTWYIEDWKKRESGNWAYEKVGSISGSSCPACPFFVCDFCGASFTVRNNEGNPVGTIKKLGVSSCKDWLLECYTEADKYTVEFLHPEELKLDFKLATLAAVFQIDFNFFEDKRGMKQCHCCDLYCCGYALPCLPLCCIGCCAAVFAAMGCKCGCCEENQRKDQGTLHAGAPSAMEMQI
uniref:Phospholipid scramblase n=1 Tax=Aplanochytrium stocchinoi TaxID=215587 RepID=A0A7S3PRM3_9STRA|mmetsp:Transcript_11040/g.13807  ORF Transcript_11040/g.13807 Transcript_11040/m.13807 type:complete len:339 (-) Transcript_11040:178-1194(-)|eukprot:CAMPEP_0204829882 /NCGR_PEP_ID=MMETSP1346-20131115/8198_1 /ASSEMBLY_ACC=CAM_ASM_000771 /TAXON_ID=215587 /ORGANISM="Aplanochytrium stocchinoi, Strain GSBS06" /LENGTH=338 /DNA_ID=CAMNT_0051959973 /DNA_START=219 /DNA_END=1235 /DNA_ORIENTATION=-